MKKIIEIIKKYPGIIIDIIFVSGATNYLIYFSKVYYLAAPEKLFFVVPLVQALVLALAAALQRQSELESRFKRIIFSCLFLICVAPVFYVAVVFFGIKIQLFFLVKGSFILFLMFITFFIAEAYYKNLTATTAKLTQNKLAKTIRKSITFLKERQLLTTVLLLMLMPLYWNLLQTQMGFSSVRGSGFLEYWNQIFYSGKFFLMFYFLAYRILLLLRPPYSYIEIVTAIVGFLSFIGLINF